MGSCRREGSWVDLAIDVSQRPTSIRDATSELYRISLLVLRMQARFHKSSGVRRLAASDLLGCAGHNDLAAGMSAFRSEIDYVIGGFDHIM